MKAWLTPSLSAAALLVLVAPAAAQGGRVLMGRPIEGGITVVALHGPDYLGARESGTSVRPGFYVRWGRVSLSSGGGWAARRQDYERRGLGIELSHSDDFDLSLGLRSDSGRDESTNPALAGMGDVKRTLRGRIGATYRFAPGWQAQVSWTTDVLGRGGGYLLETKVQHDWKLSQRLTLTSAAQVAYGGPRYLQAYYGVTPEQSARSGYAVYTPGGGLRDVSGYVSLKAELGDDWVLMAGPGANYMLGPAADSPLTQRRSAWNFSAGVGWRF